MTMLNHTLRRVMLRKPKTAAAPAELETVAAITPGQSGAAPELEISPTDPIVPYFQSAPGAVELAQLELDSPALEQMRAQGITMVVPLVTQGELIGLLNLGPRLSDQDYSPDDRRLLESLAAQVAPAVKVGQLVREQEVEVRARERLEQELEVARLIQQNFLPKELPDLDGWRVAAYYRPARTVGGDFYDFIELPGGLIGLVVGDVTDKGVPAAMVMAATRSVLRAAAQRLLEPGTVLQRINETLCSEIPPNMFVTCLYGVLDPATGLLRYANAGHNLPIIRGADGVVSELRATGMPLGLMPGMDYEEKEAVLAPGSSVLLYSDGLTEAHDAKREMFGTPRVRERLATDNVADELIADLLARLDDFTDADAEQEDDITLVALARTGAALAEPEIEPETEMVPVLAFSLPSAEGNEREAMRRVGEVAETAGVAATRLERLKTAVAEATMNAMEHGNRFDAALEVEIAVARSDSALSVRITDHGGGREIPRAETPDLEAKLDGTQSPRGWGLFLIENMVDEVRTEGDQHRHTLELITHLKGDGETDGSDRA
jgi:serine phosphatase RsbU (regulator of sigma subunit)/anti-sigma regulatory factor (Ser/Thr protein kinase)